MDALSTGPPLESLPEMRRIEDSTFAVVFNGADDSPAPPAGPLRDFLIARGARRVTTIVHPLEPEDGPEHRITHYEHGVARRRTMTLPLRPPRTYFVDPLVPLMPPQVDAWLGLNNLACARGLLQRQLGRAQVVVYWAIDFVPERFGKGVVTQVYDYVDAWCCRAADARFEVSGAASEGRSARHDLRDDRMAPVRVVPMGAWTSHLPRTGPDGWQARKVIFLGHLVRRQGVGKLLEALSVLERRGVDFTAEIAGRGPLLHMLEDTAIAHGLGARVRFVGFIDEREALEAFVASASVAVAPYDTTVESFTRYADPSKIRAYMAAGVPVVLTDVPPNADELAREGGAEIVAYGAEAIADGIQRALDPEAWTRRRASAIAYSQGFDWDTLLVEALRSIGFT